MSEASIPDWISSIAAAVGAVAVVVGLRGANKKIDDFQTNTRLLKRAEAAENLISLVLNVEDAFRDMRNPLDSIPVEKAGDRKYGYQRRYDRVVRYNDLFQRLREAQIRQRTLIGDEEVDQSVDHLFKARNALIIAIQTLSENLDMTTNDDETRKLMIETRQELYGSFSERDSFGKRVIESVQTVEENLKPFARLEGNVGA